MIAIPNKYEAHFFTDISDLQPSADTIPPLLDAFRDLNLLPSTYTELGLLPQAQVRLRLSSPNNEWKIDFDTLRISIEKNSIRPLKDNLGTPEGFTRNAADFFGRILSRFPKKGNRLSLVTSEFMAEMPEERLREIYERFLVPVRFYKEHAPVGWNSRTSTRISKDIRGNEETMNVITQVNRVQGSFSEEGGAVPFDRILVQFDINTYQRKTELRFDVADVSAFYSIALQIRSEILAQVAEGLNG